MSTLAVTVTAISRRRRQQRRRTSIVYRYEYLVFPRMSQNNSNNYTIDLLADKLLQVAECILDGEEIGEKWNKQRNKILNEAFIRFSLRKT